MEQESNNFNPRKYFAVTGAVAALVFCVGLFFVLKIGMPGGGAEKTSAALAGAQAESQSPGHVIKPIKVLKLDENRQVIEDISEKVKAKDGNWAAVEAGQYVRVVFGQKLNASNDLTIYARKSQSLNPNAQNSSSIIVYPEGGERLIAKFPEIKQARSYMVYLNNLEETEDAFDLKINCGVSDTPQSGGCGVEVDWVVDPSEAGVTLNSGIKLNSGVQLAAPAADWTCGHTLVDTRDSKTYATVQIGNMCWMAENINVGTMTAGVNNQGTSCSTPDGSDIQKYCYNDTDSNCTTYGGLYQWDQTMCGAGSCNGTGAPPNDACASPVQGICPTGWHIPSHYELTTLERAVCTSDTCATDFPYNTSKTGWRGTNEGTKLKTGGTSGFNGLMTGRRSMDGSFSNVASYTYFWSSFQSSSSNAWYRGLRTSGATVHRSTDPKSFGFSVRCLKN